MENPPSNEDAPKRSCLHDLRLKEKLMKQNLEKLMFQHYFGSYLFQSIGFLAAFTSLLQTGMSYSANPFLMERDWYNTLDQVFCVLLAVVWIMKVYASQHRWLYLISVNSLMDVVTFVPVLAVRHPDIFSHMYFYIIISRYIRIIIFTNVLSKYHQLGQTDVDRQMSQVYILGILLAYISSGVYTQVENRAYLIDKLEGVEGDDPLSTLPDPELPLYFHISCYFVGVTLLTVGYGDITPTCQEGQMTVVLLLLVTLILVPRSTNELLRLMAMQSMYRRLYYKSPEMKHLIVSGTIALTSIRSLCDELFHDDHGE